MAAEYYNEDMQILEEMRQLFPKIPDSIIQSCIRQCQGDKEVCCRLLRMYDSPNHNLLDPNVAASYGNLELQNSQIVGWQHFKNPNNSRSQSFSGAGNTSFQENTRKPQSAPVNNEMPFIKYGSYYPVGHHQPSMQYPPQITHHKSTLEIPPRYRSRVDLKLQPPIHQSPELFVAVSTNGPSVSKFSHSPLNSNSQIGHSFQTSPTARNDDNSFIQALLSYQGERYKQLHRELTVGEETLHKLQREVATLEESLPNRTAFGGHMMGAGGDVLRSMRDEITKLRVECHCLSVEADICTREQNQQGGDFYQNIFTGQVGPIPPVPSSDNNGNQVEDIEGSRWKCIRCTFNNHPALNACEMCELPRKTIDC